MSVRLPYLNPAWAALTWGFLCSKTRPVLRASKAAHHLHRTSAGVLRNYVPFNGLTGSGAGTDVTHRGGSSSFNVQVWRTVSMSSSMSQRMVWVDLEMTGLDVDRDRIIEMACIITDSDLNILAEGPNLIINQPDSILDGMSDWCKEHHGKSGLTQAVRDSKITLEQAEYEFLSFVRQHTPPGQCPLAGNSVHADKRFLDKYMPQFMYHLHYRIIDVSTIKELCRPWKITREEYEPVSRVASSLRWTDKLRVSMKQVQVANRNIFEFDSNMVSKLQEPGNGNVIERLRCRG
ncbi:Oligoribonuclease, mitochondrial [Collichthys lucidus]|uniref:Oligoribonuclease, mitochondrial n=1 Tax=Collichthys lucidus TaxID=240159 RepID=A0A4U5V8S4_COLLU|nr:Oligoribonuclease, mitochondrial [Collichthys lucidus]